jgi:hypothetical protein
MLNSNKLAVAVALVVGSMSSAALADAGPKYTLKRIPMGPRHDNYVVIRTDTQQRERPYALTGSSGESRRDRAAARPTPSHPKGTHGPY